MKKRSIIIILAIVLISGTMVYTLANNKKEIDIKKEVKISDSRIAVTTETAQMRRVNNQLKLTGTAEPSKEVVVASETSGKIVQVNFKIGDYVNKGSILAKVDDGYKQLAYENALLNYNKYKEDYDRYKVLRQGDAVSEMQLRDMKVGFENAEIQLKNVKKQLDDTNITAPFSGYITTKNTEEGAFVNMGSPIAGIADISNLKVVLSVSESDVYNLSIGHEATVITDVYPGVNFNARISNVGSRGSKSHIYPVEIIIPNSTVTPLKAGTYVNVDVNLGTTGERLMIPRDAIISSIKDPSVYVTDGETVKLTRINTGKDYNSYLEVTSGLEEGNMVITTGQINLMDGAKVIVVN